MFGADVPTSPSSSSSSGERSFSKRVPRSFLLLFCFGGLQVGIDFKGCCYPSVKNFKTALKHILAYFMSVFAKMKSSFVKCFHCTIHRYLQ